MVDAPATASSRYFEKAMAIAKEDLEWWHCERVALLDVGSINFDIGDTSVWNEERLTGLHERTMNKGYHIRWARPIARVYTSLPGDSREVARQRWLTFNGDHGFVTSQFTVDGENGSYTGIVLNLPESLAALSEERAKRVPPPRTVMEMLEDWARRSTKRRVEDLRRVAIRSYARTLHAYANTLVANPEWLRESLNLRARRRRNRKDR